MPDTNRQEIQHGVPTARPDRHQGQRAVVRELGHVRHPARRQPGARMHAGRARCRVQLLRQRRGLRGRQQRSDHGSRPPGARMAEVLVRAHDQGVLGHPRQRAEHAEHAQPQVSDAGDRRFARAPPAGLRRRVVLPSPRSRHDDRRDRVGDARHRLVGQGPVLGYQRMAGRRHPRRDRVRRTSSPAQAGHRAVAVQPARAHQGRGRVRPDHRRLRLRQHDLEPARVRAVDRQVPRRDPRRLPRRTRPATSGWRKRWSTPTPSHASSGCGRSPNASGARWRNSRSRGAPRTRTSRP